MPVSSACRTFIDLATQRSWQDAVRTLNGLNMYEMLRALKAFEDADRAALRAALASLAGAVNGPRIEYALTVVETSHLPATAPGDLASTGQVQDARRFLRHPKCIFVETTPRGEIGLRNDGVSSSGNALMQRLFGAPRDTYSQACQAVTNRTLAARIQTASVGPFRATGLDSAVAALTAIMTQIQTRQRLVYRFLSSAGMLCARNVRGSTTSVSNHSWGCAIDLKIDSILDARGDGVAQYGLELIAPMFNDAGWYWGIDFPTEDAQHFEAGSALVQTW